VVGGVGTALARHGVNIATFALGRGDAGAVAVIGVDDHAALESTLADIRNVAGVKNACLVRL